MTTHRPTTRGDKLMKIRIAALLVCLTGAAAAFAQTCPPQSAAPVANTPNGVNVPPSSVNFNWTPVFNVSGISGYEVKVNGFGTACSVSGEGSSSCTASNIPPGAYSWKVETKFSTATACTLDSNILPFTVGCPQGGP